MNFSKMFQWSDIKQKKKVNLRWMGPAFDFSVFLLGLDISPQDLTTEKSEREESRLHKKYSKFRMQHKIFWMHNECKIKVHPLIQLVIWIFTSGQIWRKKQNEFNDQKCILYIKITQGFYSSVKIKFQESSKSFLGVICFFPGVPFWTKLVYIIGLKSVYNLRLWRQKF